MFCLNVLEFGDFLLIAERGRNRITQVFLDDDYSITPLRLPAGLRPRDVAYDPVEQRVYWTDISRRQIIRAFLNGSATEVIVRDVLGLAGLAVDVVARNLYLVDNWRRSIEVANLDGTYRKTLVNENLRAFKGLALDLKGR